MFKRRMQHTVSFAASRGVAFDYVTTPGLWPKWYPATVSVEGQTSRPAEKGDRVVDRVRKLGIAGSLHWVVLDSRPPAHFSMETTSIDMAVFRRGRIRIQYEFEGTGKTSSMVRTFEYDLPSSLWLLDRLHLHRDLRSEGTHALGTLQVLVQEVREPD